MYAHIHLSIYSCIQMHIYISVCAIKDICIANNIFIICWSQAWFCHHGVITTNLDLVDGISSSKISHTISVTIAVWNDDEHHVIVTELIYKINS